MASDSDDAGGLQFLLDPPANGRPANNDPRLVPVTVRRLLSQSPIPSRRAATGPPEPALGGDVPEHGFGARLFERDGVAEGEEIDLDVSGLPPTWDDGDGVDQATLTNNILAQYACDDSLDRKYDSVTPDERPLTDFRKMYEKGADRGVREHAMRLLKDKIKVTIPNRLKYDKDSRDIVYSNMGVSLSC